jgi:hypothetical protein
LVGSDNELFQYDLMSGNIELLIELDSDIWHLERFDKDITFIRSLNYLYVMKDFQVPLKILFANYHFKFHTVITKKALMILTGSYRSEYIIPEKKGVFKNTPETKMPPEYKLKILKVKFN